jgi:drug/metabolite transporter (DMT)-like permease
VRSLYIWNCIAITVATAASGDVLIALAMRRLGDLDVLRRRQGLVAVIAQILSSGVFLLGVLLMAIAFFSNLMGLSWADLSLMGPATASLTFVANAIAAKFILHENVDLRRWVATLSVGFGVLLLR